jgi:hypothetical protein
MEPNTSELNLTSFIHLTKFTAGNNLVAKVTIEHKQYKGTA